MEGEIHLGANGPTPCPAKIKCRLGGEHFTNMQEAEAAWAKKNGVEATPTPVSRKMQRESKGSTEAGKPPLVKEESSEGTTKPKIIAMKKVSPKLFPYASREEVAELQRKVMELQPLYGTYQHDYSADDPSTRPGEQEFIASYDPTKFTTETTSHTADNIIFKVENDKLKVLLIKRGGHPFKDHWAHPGGFIDNVKDAQGRVIRKETRQEAAARELKEETNIDLDPSMITPVATYDHPGRDPRMDVHMNTHVVFFEDDVEFSPGDDAAEAEFVPVEEVYNGERPMAFDHRLSIKNALDYIASEGRQ